MNKLLIANRGEIALRIMRTAASLGYGTVAVYSDADANAPHVDAADEAVYLGPSSADQSYLRIDKLMDAAQRTGADAVHPGYGFLSENAAFAEACADHDLTFIGPSPKTIKAMGSKRRAKAMVEASGVPCVPGFRGEAQDEATLASKAAEIGFPIMIKASAGGGGRGMRLVQDAAQFEEAVRDARSEARKAFGDDELVLERALLRPRHIEIQIAADRHGNVIHLGERDCSVQRRHQKVIEEAPSPFVDDALRAAMGEAAVQAARACDYVGVGTVEFLVNDRREFYFLEMNTRLQVEHPVTELITGIDLVGWQLAIAEGEPLPLSQDAVRFHGHAIEARLYAEEPRLGFLPQTGTIHVWRPPPDVRVDDGIREGQLVTAHYDPQMAKIIAHGPDRETARRRLTRALDQTVLLSVPTNRAYLRKLLELPAFTAGEVTTAFVADHESALEGSLKPSSFDLACAAILFYPTAESERPRWSSAAPRTAHLRLGCEGEETSVAIIDRGNALECRINSARHVVDVLDRDHRTLTLVADGIRRRMHFARTGATVFLDTVSGGFEIKDITDAPPVRASAEDQGAVHAPMAGVVVHVAVAKGDAVVRGDTIAVMEAMKMEMPLKAACTGIVERLNASVGQQVANGDLLALIANPAGDGNDV